MTLMRKAQVETVRDHASWFGVTERYVQLSLTILCVFFCVLTAPSAQAQENAKNVLIVYGAAPNTEHGSLDLVESAVRAHVPELVNFQVVHLDHQRLENELYRKSLAETLRNGYSEVKPDLLIVAFVQALQFVIENRDKMFPGVPIVFMAVSTSELEGLKILPGITGHAGSVGLGATIDLALRLHPDATTVAVIVDAPGVPERHWVAATHSELLRYQNRVREIYLMGLPSTQMLEKVAALPPHTVALFELVPRSSTEPAVGAFDVLAALAPRVPTYSAWETLCLDGCIGGAFQDWQKESRQTGEIAARVLNGERPENIPIVNDSSFQTKVDWRQLRRWHIPESALPAGSVVLYRPPSFWERDRKYILPAIVLIVAQALLIVSLLFQRARKRKAEAVLRESEKRFRVMADTTPSLVWMCDSYGKITYLNERRVAFTTPNPNAGYGDTWSTYIHPDDLEEVMKTVSQALKAQQPFSTEYRLRRSDGVYRWMLDVASPRVNGDGSFGGFIGSAIDTTDQKLAQQALERVSGQLIEAQEKERSRIARELHDDICQRLALLSMELERANRASDGSPTTKIRLEEIRNHCSEIAGDVQSLSHQLHSSKLDILGVVAAIKGFCKEFSKQYEVHIDFSEKNVPSKLHKDVSLSLFRVAQEALHNAMKYSGVDQFSVELSGEGNVVQLVVSDAGAGFDVEEAKKDRGLGLVSMQERIHLMHGSFSVESKPWHGTKVIVSVPVIAKVPRTQGNAGDDQTASHYRSGMNESHSTLTGPFNDV
jgi:PAS domain S-box-containing protein